MRLGAITAGLMLTSAAIALSTAACAKPAAKPASATMHDEMLLRADEVIYDSEHAVTTAHGHVEIDYQGSILMAEKVVYDQNADSVVASGHVVLLDKFGNVEFSNRATLTNQLRDGALQGFAALIGTTGRLAGTSATRKGGVSTVATRAAYTNCKICNQPGQRTPLWKIEAARVVYEEPEHRLFYYDAVVDAFGIPILYTPWFTNSDPTVKRSSGLLMAEGSPSGTLGYYARLPLYVSLTDSRDFTIAPMVTGSKGDVLEGEYRERWNEGGFWLQPTIAENPHGGILDNRSQIYSSFFGAGLIPIDTVWHTGFDVQLASNETFLDLYKISQVQELTNDLYLEGINGRSRFAITGYFFQGLIQTDNNSQYPVVLPQIEYTYIPGSAWFGGQFRLDFSTAAIYRQTGEDDQRLTGAVDWKLPLLTGDGQLLTLTADVRGDVYHIDNPLESPLLNTASATLPANHYISRGLPYAALDWRWPFAQASGAATYIFEPIAQLIAAPYGGNPAGIPNETSNDFEFDATDIFSFNRLPGYDVVETGPRSNVGFRTQAIFPTGSVELLVGEELRLKPDPIFAADTGIAGTQSDLASRLSINFLPRFTMSERLDIDTRNATVDRNEVDLAYQYGLSSLELSYLKLPEEQVTTGLVKEEVNAQALIGIWRNWLVFASGQRNLADSTMIAEEFGLGYDDDCVAISLSYRRTYTTNRNVGPSTDFPLLRFNLKTNATPQSAQALPDNGMLFPQHLYSHIPL